MLDHWFYTAALLSRRASTSTAFTPLSLFSASEQGVWYDPSDFSSMFQDSAATTPVTAVGQTVGTIFDKRLGASASTNAADVSSATGAYFTTPDSVALSVTGDIDLRVNVAMTDWTPAAVQVLIGKRSGGAADVGYSLRVNTAGTLNLLYGDSSTTVVSASSTVATGFTDGAKRWVRVTRASSSGDVIFYTSTDGTSWAQLGTTVSTAAGSIYDSTQAVGIGANNGSGEGAIGRIYRAQIYNGINGTLVGDFDPTRYTSGNTFTAATGEVYTRAGPVSITPDGNHAFQSTAAARPLLQQEAGGQYYLAFDGTDDSLATSAINFSATDKLGIFAGLRKLSDAAQGVVAELTASIAANTGAFLLSAPNSAAANYNFSSKGTTQVDNTVTTYTAPITNVLSGIADIAAPSNIIRANGSQVGSVATSQGTGNFANAALNIGQRSGGTLRFNGRLYGMIVLGRTPTATEITNTETWMNTKTGAY